MSDAADATRIPDYTSTRIESRLDQSADAVVHVYRATTMIPAGTKVAPSVLFEPLNQLAVVALGNGERWFRNGSRWQLVGGGAGHVVGWPAIAPDVVRLISAGLQP